MRWSAVSDDGHIVQGVLAFSVGTGRPPPAPTLRVTNEVGFGTVFSRWVFFAGLLVGSGLALFDLLVWRPIARSDIRTGWIALGLAAMFVSSHGLVRESHAGVATRFGLTVQIASALAATGAAAAAIAVADRSAARYGIVLAVLLLPVPTVAGHALDPGRSWLEVPVDILHVAAAAVWVGGLFALVVVVPREGAAPEIVERAVRRFSTLALAAVVAVGTHRRRARALRAVGRLAALDDGLRPRDPREDRDLRRAARSRRRLARDGPRRGRTAAERRAPRARPRACARRGRGYPDLAPPGSQLRGRRIRPHVEFT